ncbi:glutathione S-transferase theta-1-like [Sphaerodactylus townsendi]|uniref:Glutathione S-transferase theta-1 n=1 Tax=Sphaerodactylus townsendi TaxID=933632 RepID=A0ACB8FY09_9SAUR|nr:glutathione S-transferase theta-1-like [Sphaerodactylus townsendi]
MGLELYLDLLSQPCRSVYIFAKKNGIPFEFKPVTLMKGQHKSEEFSKVNLLGKVPALKDADFTLAESIAILLYLARKFKTPDHWYPSDLQKRARVDEYLSWQHMATRLCGSKVFLIKAIAPAFLDEPLSPAKLDGAIEDLNGVLKLFEEKFLQDRRFITGQEISLADLVAIVEVMQPLAGGYDVFEGRPKMAAWRQRVEEAIGKDLFLEAHEPLLKPKAAENLPPELKEQLKKNLLKYIK